MHAIVVEALGDAGELHWLERPDPTPGPGQVLVKVGLTSVNFADIQARRGAGAGLAKTPFTPGLDAMGTIVAVGEGVPAARIGERVACNPDGGSYAELVVARATLAYRMDDGIPDEAAASSTVLVTAYNLLMLATRMQPGETVLVHAAAGGVGSVAVQMARALGAGKVFATAGGPRKVALARELGADLAIDYTHDDFAAILTEATGGKGVDAILDAVGGEVFERGFPILAEFGRYAIYGQSSGGAAATVRVDALHRANRAVVGYSSGHYRRSRAEKLTPAAEAAYGLVRDGKVRILEGGRYPLSDAAAAHRLVESRASTGRVFLTV
jgi:NADPH2:quinone reductase